MTVDIDLTFYKRSQDLNCSRLCELPLRLLMEGKALINCLTVACWSCTSFLTSLQGAELIHAPMFIACLSTPKAHTNSQVPLFLCFMFTAALSSVLSDRQ